MIKFDQEAIEKEIKKSISDMFRKLDEIPISRIAITEKWDIFSAFYTGLDTGYYSVVKNTELKDQYSEVLTHIDRITHSGWDIEEMWSHIKEYIE
jgi:hypothetical protein